MSETGTEFSWQQKSDELERKSRDRGKCRVEFERKAKRKKSKKRRTDTLATCTLAKCYTFTASSASFAPQCICSKNKVIHIPYAVINPKIPAPHNRTSPKTLNIDIYIYT
ncbi:hypothetical protein QLX08_006283 [Tetragonisca angustula]|uniref:Uncharacterized protein n=1 Tax=Tetragonisca angustula TaxID=166442 RepID=A0AAW0ZX19_9HYME